MKKILIEPHYLGSLEYFGLVQNHDKIVFEVQDFFTKQTFRNRFYLLGSNRTLCLSIPLDFSNKTITKDVKIDYSQRWVKDHWGAVYSSYGKAPFFEYFADDFNKVWNVNHQFLIDVLFEMFSITTKLLKIDVKFDQSTEYKEKPESCDWRNVIQPKKDFLDRNIYKPVSYSQLFGDSFVPNLSILDLLMCEGPMSSSILKQSFIG